MDFSRVKRNLEKNKITLAGLMIQSEDLRLSVCDAIRNNPVHYVDVLFGVKLWRGEEGGWGQAEILESIFENKYTSVGSGHGIGKTFLTQCLPPLWLLSHAEHLFSYVIVTGADLDAVENQIFPGIRERMLSARLPIGPPPPKASIRMVWGDKWRAWGRSPAIPEGGQGAHSEDGTLLLGDEASSLGYLIFNSYLSVLTSIKDAIALLGNYIHSDGPFADIGNKRFGKKTWVTASISSYDTPNARHPERPPIGSLATLAWILEMEDMMWKPGTPEHESRILGRVPDQSVDIFIARSTLQAALSRPTIPWQSDTNLKLAADIARSETGDNSTFTVKGDHSVHLHKSMRGVDKNFILNYIFDIRAGYAPRWVPNDDAELRAKLESIPEDMREADWKAEYQEVMNRMHRDLNNSRLSAIPVDNVFVDATGVGTGLADDLEMLGYPPTVRFIAAGQAQDAQGCANRRAEVYKRLKESLATLAIPPEYQEPFSELCTLRYKYDGKGRLLLESKDDYKKRYERSPDHADGLSLTFASVTGERVFAIAQDALPIKLNLRPTITHDERNGKGKQWWLHLEGQPRQSDTPGILMRALWLASRNPACVWVHKDASGIWTIYDALTSSDTTIRAFWGEVLERSKDQRYTYDVFSAPEDAERTGESHLDNELWAVVRKLPVTPGQPRPSTPTYQQPLGIRGSAGLDTLNRLILSQMSWYEHHPFWEGKDRMKFRTPEALAAYPDEVVDALSRARLQERDWTDELEDARPEGLVAEGGPLVACLRLLAIQGAGI